MSEKTKILEMLANGQITVEEASDLLSAIATDFTSIPTTTSSTSNLIKKKTRMLHISIYKEDSADVNIRVPLALAKFAMRFVPAEAKANLEINNQNIDLKEMLELLKQDGIPDGKLLEADTVEDGKQVRVLIEVV